MAITPISEIKGRATKEVTSPNGITFLIRKFSQLEMEGLGISAILSVDINTLATEKVETKLDSDKMLKVARQVIEEGCRKPPISYDPAAIDDPEKLHISDIAGDDLWLFQEIMTFSGISSEAQADVQVLAGNGKGPGSSIQSHEDTVGSLTSS